MPKEAGFARTGGKMEDTLLYYIIFVTGMFLVIFMLRYILVAQNLLGIRFRPPEFELIDRNQLPSHLKDLYETKESELEQLGFHFIYTQKVRDMVPRKHEYRYYFVYFNPLEHTYASIAASPEADTHMPLWVDFNSYFKNGGKLVTLNGIRHNIIGSPPETILQDGYFASMDQQLNLHLKSLKNKENQNSDIHIFEESTKGFEEMVAEENRRQKKYLEHLEKTGYLYRPSKSSSDRLLKFTASIKVAHSMFNAMNKLVAMKKQLARAGVTVDIPVEMEVENYENTRHMLQNKSHNSSGKFIFLLVTVVMFIGLFGLLFSFDIAAMLFIVVLLHESGHLLAMRAMGYKDLSMLFIPLFGAVAMGTDKGVPTYKRVIAYFAGPAPGILMAVVLWYMLLNGMISPDYLSLTITAFATLAVINYFNLLPLVPLDGGRILETVLFSRSQLLQNIFLGFSFIGLIVLAYYLEEPLLWMLAVFVPFGYKENFTRSKLRRKVKQRVSGTTDAEETDVAYETFAAMKEEPYQRMPYQKKFKVVQFIENSLRRPKAAPKTAVVTIIAYIALFVLPLLYILYPILSGNGLPNALKKCNNPCAAVMTLESPSISKVEASVSRFKRIDAAKSEGTSMVTWHMCFYLNEDGMKPGLPLVPQADFLARLWGRYGPPDRIENGYSYTLLDLESDRIITAYCTNMVSAYGSNEGDRHEAIQAINMLHALLNRTAPADCEWEMTVDYSKFQSELEEIQGSSQQNQDVQTEIEEIPVLTYKLGSKNGKPYMTILPEQKNSGHVLKLKEK